jgi:hypothetical protein
MPAQDCTTSGRNRIHFVLIALGAIAALLALAAPAVAGRLIGDLWVTTMSAVMGLLGNLTGVG